MNSVLGTRDVVTRNAAEELKLVPKHVLPPIGEKLLFNLVDSHSNFFKHCYHLVQALQEDFILLRQQATPFPDKRKTQVVKIHGFSHGVQQPMPKLTKVEDTAICILLGFFKDIKTFLIGVSAISKATLASACVAVKVSENVFRAESRYMASAPENFCSHWISTAAHEIIVRTCDRLQSARVVIELKICQGLGHTYKASIDLV
mmetsp:Transcript_28268/g.46806  ORF Transcript_28268/g.46806 Transcript_28268/m.46806 type:complete len:203 (+) Transcript_28268:751-1359(+)